MMLTNGSGCPLHSDLSVSCQRGSALTPAPISNLGVSEWGTQARSSSITWHLLRNANILWPVPGSQTAGVGFINRCFNKPSTSLKSRSPYTVTPDKNPKKTVLCCCPLVAFWCTNCGEAANLEEPHRLGPAASCFPGGETESW